jgi:hypothetical protein
MWKRTGTKGDFLSGSFEPEGREGVIYKFLAFPNKDKREGDKKPDYRIVVTVDDEPKTEPPEGNFIGGKFQATDSDVPF